MRIQDSPWIGRLSVAATIQLQQIGESILPKDTQRGLELTALCSEKIVITTAQWLPVSAKGQSFHMQISYLLFVYMYL